MFHLSTLGYDLEKVVSCNMMLLQLKVYKSEEQPVVSVDSRKFAIDSSFQPSTVSTGDVTIT